MKPVKITRLACDYTVVQHNGRVYAYYYQKPMWVLIPPVGDECKAFKSEEEVMEFIIETV